MGKIAVVGFRQSAEAGDRFNVGSVMRLFRKMAGDRREFFRAAARYTLLAGLTAAGYLSARTGKLKGQRCVRQGICGDCLQFANCGLPAALSRKQQQGSSV